MVFGKASYRFLFPVAPKAIKILLFEASRFNGATDTRRPDPDRGLLSALKEYSSSMAKFCVHFEFLFGLIFLTMNNANREYGRWKSEIFGGIARWRTHFWGRNSSASDRNWRYVTEIWVVVKLKCVTSFTIVTDWFSSQISLKFA